MKIVDIREISVPLEGAPANAVVSFASHNVSLVAVVTDVIRNGVPVVGYAFNSIGRFAQGGIMHSRIIPRLMNAAPDLLLRNGQFDCEAVYKTAMRDEKPGGHGDRASAVAALELAFWDINAKLADEPANVTIARHFGRVPLTHIPVYAAGGYYYGEDGVAGLQEELRGYVDAGFHAFKIKVGGVSISEDLKRIEAALEICGDSSRLAVDANGRFNLKQALTFARAIEPYKLRWFEEIGDPLDFALNHEISKAYPGPIATGENLFSVADVRNLLNFGGMRPGLDVFQMDAGLSYGLTEFAGMITLLEEFGFDRNASLPHGGHLINLHIVSGLNLGGGEVYASVFKPFGGYSPDCTIENGAVAPGQLPGFGLEGKPELKPWIDTLSA